MPLHTTGPQDNLIDRAKAAPQFGDLLDIIDDLDAKICDLTEQNDEKAMQIKELEQELKDALNRSVE